MKGCAPFVTPSSELLMQNASHQNTSSNSPVGDFVKTLTRHLLEANHTSFRHQSIHLEDGRVLSRSLSQRNTDQHEASVACLHILNMWHSRLRLTQRTFLDAGGLPKDSNSLWKLKKWKSQDTFRLWFSLSSSTPFSSKSWPVVWLTYLMLRLILPVEESTKITLTKTCNWS